MEFLPALGCWRWRVSAAALGLLVSALSRTYAIALSMVPPIMIYQLLFGGLLRAPEAQEPGVGRLAVFRTVAVQRWAFEAVLACDGGEGTRVIRKRRDTDWRWWCGGIDIPKRAAFRVESLDMHHLVFRPAPRGRLTGGGWRCWRGWVGGPSGPRRGQFRVPSGRSESGAPGPPLFRPFLNPPETGGIVEFDGGVQDMAPDGFRQRREAVANPARRTRRRDRCRSRSRRDRRGVGWCRGLRGEGFGEGVGPELEEREDRDREESGVSSRAWWSRGWRRGGVMDSTSWSSRRSRSHGVEEHHGSRVCRRRARRARDFGRVLRGIRVRGAKGRRRGRGRDARLRARPAAFPGGG